MNKPQAAPIKENKDIVSQKIDTFLSKISTIYRDVLKTNIPPHIKTQYTQTLTTAPYRRDWAVVMEEVTLHKYIHIVHIPSDHNPLFKQYTIILQNPIPTHDASGYQRQEQEQMDDQKHFEEKLISLFQTTHIELTIERQSTGLPHV